MPLCIVLQNTNDMCIAMPATSDMPCMKMKHAWHAYGMQALVLQAHQAGHHVKHVLETETHAKTETETLETETETTKR